MTEALGIVGRPDRRLRAYVSRYVGYRDVAAAPVRRREVPSGRLPLVISFGPAIRVFDGEAVDDGVLRDSFLAGLASRPARTEYVGEQHGVQVDLTPIGARLLSGVSMHLLANRTLGLDDLLGVDAPRLTERLHERTDWSARFALLDAEIGARVEAAPAPPAAIMSAWDRLVESGGAIRIDWLARELGWSRKRLLREFREEIGLGPKTAARVLRFGHSLRLIAARRLPLVQVAYQAGYADQAHFTREFVALAGTTPTRYLAELERDRLAIELARGAGGTFVQDRADPPNTVGSERRKEMLDDDRIGAGPSDGRRADAHL